ncbi:MAG: Ppx/GppA family phosphatase [Acidimicrobiales bacterium]|jgi:exopolyphosphatase/guanosine-5'-triphosphate,3'-diphosphate pyrophosphatase|nr:Ppx/GppA family phosphatase [Acidimicrobiales bacterium]
MREGDRMARGRGAERTGSDGGGRVHAAIDIGTNSFHLLVARLHDEGGFEIVTREKEPVRLGSGAGEMDRLAPDAVDRGIAALRRFRAVADAAGADITAVATSAVREAANRDEFLQRAWDEAGIDVDVISGVEEARLIHLGVLQALPVFDQQILLVDIGGGSTELLIGHQGRTVEAVSVKLGAIRLTDRFFPDGTIGRRAVEDCRSYVRSYLAPAVGRLGPHHHDVAVGSSGTILTLAAMIEAARGVEPGRPLNAVAFGPEDLAAVVRNLLKAKTTEARRRIAGLDSRRADIIVGGALLLEQVMQAFGIRRMLVSEYALREGVFLDRFQQDRADALQRLVDIRSESVQRMLDRYGEDIAHVTCATRLALRLFDELAPLHGLDDEARRLLEHAGLLHNVGLFVSHAAHHKHSYYVIRNTDQLVGFTDREIELMAQVARYHRKSDPSLRQPEHAALHPDDRRLVALLAGILRIGIALDRGHSGAVDDLRCRIDADGIHVDVRAEGDIGLELYTADQRRGLLEQELGRPVAITG